MARSERDGLNRRQFIQWCGLGGILLTAGGLAGCADTEPVVERRTREIRLNLFDGLRIIVGEYQELVGGEVNSITGNLDLTTTVSVSKGQPSYYGYRDIQTTFNNKQIDRMLTLPENKAIIGRWKERVSGIRQAAISAFGLEGLGLNPVQVFAPGVVRHDTLANMIAEGVNRVCINQTYLRSDEYQEELETLLLDTAPLVTECVPLLAVSQGGLSLPALYEPMGCQTLRDTLGNEQFSVLRHRVTVGKNSVLTAIYPLSELARIVRLARTGEMNTKSVLYPAATELYTRGLMQSGGRGNLTEGNNSLTVMEVVHQPGDPLVRESVQGVVMSHLLLWIEWLAGLPGENKVSVTNAITTGTAGQTTEALNVMVSGGAVSGAFILGTGSVRSGGFGVSVDRLVDGWVSDVERTRIDLAFDLSREAKMSLVK